MTSIQTKYGLVLTTILFAFLVYISGFKKNKPTCNNYVVNVYLYLALSLSLMGLLVYHIPWEKAPVHPFIVIIFSFLFIILLSIQRPFQTKMNDVLLAHLYWFLFILSISAFSWVYFKIPMFSQHLNSAIMMVALIFVVMSAIVYIAPEFFKKTYGVAMSTLLLVLIMIIIFELSMIFFSKNYGMSQSYRYVSYLVIVVFSAFISYDTSRIFDLAEKCTNYPNYPQSSVSFFLDVINLFARIITLQAR